VSEPGKRSGRLAGTDVAQAVEPAHATGMVDHSPAPPGPEVAQAVEPAHATGMVDHSPAPPGPEVAQAVEPAHATGMVDHSPAPPGPEVTQAVEPAHATGMEDRSPCGPICGRPVIAIDPGTEKCGLAVVRPDRSVAARAIVPSHRVTARVMEWAARLQPQALLVGAGTGALAVRQALLSSGLDAASAPEKNTTIRARALYFREHPPRGWRRLVPLSLQVPPAPVDDYAAVLIARDYLDARQFGQGEGGSANERKRRKK
jgi:hypothetical protein